MISLLKANWILRTWHLVPRLAGRHKPPLILEGGRVHDALKAQGKGAPTISLGAERRVKRRKAVSDVLKCSLKAAIWLATRNQELVSSDASSSIFLLLETCDDLILKIFLFLVIACLYIRNLIYELMFSSSDDRGQLAYRQAGLL